MGAKVVLGDRPVHVTIARLWAALSIYEKTKFIWQMLITGLLPDPKGISETVESLKVYLALHLQKWLIPSHAASSQQ